MINEVLVRTPFAFAPRLPGQTVDEPRPFNTADTSGAATLLDRSMSDILQLVRDNLKMDIVFVAEFVEEHQVFRHVEGGDKGCAIGVGDTQPLEQTFCKRIVDGRMPSITRDVPALREKQDLPVTPFPIGSYMGVPVRLTDGRLYGTLCCLTFSPKTDIEDRELARLEMAAKLVGRMLDAAEGRSADCMDC